MSTFIIHGNHPLNGTVRAVGSKNALFPVIAACLLTDEPCSLYGIPAISDTLVMLNLIRELGAEFVISNKGETVSINAKDMKNADLNQELFTKIRGSIVLLGPLLARFGKVKGFYPGGDNIGQRSISAHFDAFSQCGYIVDDHIEEGYFLISKDPHFSDEQCNIFLYEPSVTGTENIVLLNILGKGSVIIDNAACEPHVRDTCVLLKKMGALIEGEGTNRIKIQRVEKLHGAEHTLVKDHVYIATFMVLASVTGGDLYIKDVNFQDIRPMIPAFEHFNVKWEMFDETTIHIVAKQDLKCNESYNIYNNIGIYSESWPKLPSDLLPILIALGVCSTGTFLYFEKMYADRIKYTKELERLGVSIELLDAHRAKIIGNSPLHPGELSCPDLRSGILYLSIMLMIHGESILHQIQHIERGYPKIEDVLTSLGADIIKHEDSF